MRSNMESTKEIQILSNNIRYLFASHPGSQRDFARKSNISEPSVCQWGRGTLPDMQNLITLAKYFNLDINWFFTEQDLNITENVTYNRR